MAFIPSVDHPHNHGCKKSRFIKWSIFKCIWLFLLSYLIGTSFMTFIQTKQDNFHRSGTEIKLLKLIICVKTFELTRSKTKSCIVPIHYGYISASCHITHTIQVSRRLFFVDCIFMIKLYVWVVLVRYYSSVLCHIHSS